MYFGGVFRDVPPHNTDIPSLLIFLMSLTRCPCLLTHLASALRLVKDVHRIPCFTLSGGSLDRVLDSNVVCFRKRSYSLISSKGTSCIALLCHVRPLSCIVPCDFVEKIHDVSDPCVSPLCFPFPPLPSPFLPSLPFLLSSLLSFPLSFLISSFLLPLPPPPFPPLPPPLPPLPSSFPFPSPLLLSLLLPLLPPLPLLPSFRPSLPFPSFRPSARAAACSFCFCLAATSTLF